jgi:tetratricopeptide (TPR) repeat protein
MFEEAARQAPEARMYEISAILILAALHQWTEVNERWSRAGAEWRGDIRFAFVSALIGLARGNLDDAEWWLRGPAGQVLQIGHKGLSRLWGGSLDKATLDAMRRNSPEHWREAVEAELIAEQYYFVLLWQGRYREAQSYAEQVLEPLTQLKLPTALWLERQGDALFFERDYPLARQLYEQALQDDPNSTGAYLKLSDVWFLLGDREKERSYRERIYGVLK